MSEIIHTKLTANHLGAPQEQSYKFKRNETNRTEESVVNNADNESYQKQ